MARCPFATQKILPQNATQAKIKPRKLIFHTAVDGRGSTSLYEWFKSPAAKGAESTFYVKMTGELEQYMDSEVRADAQWAGNVDAISCETEDDGNPNIPWNQAQLATLIRLAQWCHDTHGIPTTQCPTPTGAGIGWHELFPAWNQSGHTCPGPVREAQIRNVILPALAAPQGKPAQPPTNPTTKDEDFMAPPVLMQAGPPEAKTGPVFLVYASGIAVPMHEPSDIDAAKFFGAVDHISQDGTALLGIAGVVQPAA